MNRVRYPYVPQRVAQKRDIAVCASKTQLLSKKVCYKVSLYENFQRQSCSYIIHLSNVVYLDYLLYIYICGLSHQLQSALSSRHPL